MPQREGPRHVEIEAAKARLEAAKRQMSPKIATNVAPASQDNDRAARWWDETVRDAGGDPLSHSWDNGISADDAA